MYDFNQGQAAGADANNELLKIWIARYLPDLGAISSYVRYHAEPRLRVAIAESSRVATARKLRQHLARDCAHAATETHQLLLATGNRIDTWQLKNLSTYIQALYATLIDCYEQSLIFSPALEYLHTIDCETERLTAAGLVIPKFEKLLLTISPILRELKAVYFSSINRHLLGFMTTQIHFTCQHIISHLDLDERIWLAPYLQLLDELICIPWKHICSAVTTMEGGSGAVTLAKKMLPQMSSISDLTYQKALQTYPTHISSQGRIQSAGVRRSSLRDLSMFQAYIWLCILEGNVTILEKRLLPICLQVFPITKVSWELVIFAIESIVEITQLQLDTSERELFDPQAEIIKNLFWQATPEGEQITRLQEPSPQAKFPGTGNISYTW